MSDELHVWTDAELKSAEDSMLRVAFERGRRAERERIRQRIEALQAYFPDPFGVMEEGTVCNWWLERKAVLEALGGSDE